jgi:hypothetical protein
MPRKKYPKHWTEIPWDDFPMVVTWRGLTLTPEQFLFAFSDDEGYSILYPPYDNELAELFNWHYLKHPRIYMGKWISMGLYYGYPKCCIFEFTFVKRKHRHPESSAYAHYSNQHKVDKSWILCHRCADYVVEHGLEQYLAQQAWEQE